jgi:hypothetical protein
VARLGATDLGDPEYQTALMNLRVGERYVKEHERVYREYVVPLEDPWYFPGLAAHKAEQALRRVYQRPEYRDASAVAASLPTARRPRALPPPPEGPPNPNLGI